MKLTTTQKDNVMNEAITILKNYGFNVYQRKGSESYVIYENEAGNIAYLQYNGQFYGWDLATIHKPNKKSGTGFGVVSNSPFPSLDQLEYAFIDIPGQFSKREYSVKKYKSMAEYMSKDTFNSEYKLI